MPHLRLEKQLSGNVIRERMRRNAQDIAQACGLTTVKMYIEYQKPYQRTDPNLRTRTGRGNHWEYGFVFDEKETDSGQKIACLHTLYAPNFGCYGGFRPSSFYASLRLCSPSSGHSSNYYKRTDLDVSSDHLTATAEILAEAYGAVLLD